MLTGSTSSSQRVVPLKARRDLHVNEAQYLGESCWVIKDPVKLKYFRLKPRQYEVLKLLDGNKNLEQIRSGFLEAFPALRPSLTQIQNIIFDLYQQGLVFSTRPGQGHSLDFRRDQQAWQKFKQTATNLMFIRLPGFDPTRFLTSFYWAAKWLFHPAVVLWAISIVLFSWIFIGTHAHEIMLRVPTLESLVSWKSTLVIWIVLGCTKIIHELGHAFACRHFGGECHEIGVAFLIFSPCLYCDVSDSWTMKSKWRRIAIASAGIYIELLLASLSFFVWWKTQPGELHNICFLVFVVSNISTLLFNLNPLLRLDGYYILSDWLEVPNLRQKSDKVLEHAILKNLLGIAVKKDASIPSERKRQFLVYAIASMIYRSLLVVVICGLLYSMLKPFRLEYLGLLLGVISGGMGVFSWSKRMYKTAKTNVDEHNQKSRRPYVTGLAAAMALVLILFFPLPMSLKSPLQIEFADTQSLYVTTAGTLVAVHVQPGQFVREGQLLAELENPDKSERLTELLVDRHVQSIELRKQKAVANAKEISLVAENLKSIESEIQDHLAQLERLKIKATHAGKIIAPPLRGATTHSKSKLPSWPGSPLESRNRGCYLETGAHLLSIAPDPGFQAVMIVSQRDVQSLREGQRMEVKLDHLPAMTLQGTVKRISSAATAGNNFQQAATSGVPDQARLQAADPDSYRAIVRFDDSDQPLLPGIRGTGRVTTSSKTAAAWIWRNVCSTFSFQM